MPVNEKAAGMPHQLLQREQYAAGGLGRRYWDHRDRVALSLLRAEDERILDIGCGEGITLEKAMLAFPECHITGIDVMPENVRICREHGLPVDQGDVRNLGWPCNSFDAVLLMEVIEPLEEPQAAISEIRCVLRPGGVLVVVYPNDRFFRFARIATLRIREAKYDPGHVRQWTPGDLREFLEQRNFTVTDSRVIPFRLWPLCLHGVMAAVKR
jgi:2-polyprenyl-3-methyl-5-hydroxy-6-metoxy-1,4-benzoquinol methylase